MGDDRPSALDATLVEGEGTARRDLELPTIDRDVYAIGAELAAGGMGRISVAYDRRAGRPVALKELLTTSATARQRFEREAKITARLQHPAIVPIYEVGQWHDGEPFYAMKHVEGRPLDRVIEETKTVAERLALVPNLLAVADALAYAHSRRIIHRDLKPANILLGTFGETVVIDWGLAKDLTSATSDLPSDVGGSRDSIGDLTVAGTTMGTPMYMPPEQALGDVVDERADVYASGATLYHVLGGVMPYAGAKTGDEVLARLVEGPPQGLRELAPDLPPDLIAVVDKAMARTANDRYPTAKELADDLRRFLNGQLVGVHRYSLRQLVWRRLRRHLAAVIVGFVAAAALATTGVVALRRVVAAEARAQEQRDEALHSRHDAEDLMSFMLVDLRDKLKPLGRLDLLDVTAKKAVAYYDRKVEVDDTEARERALARVDLGDVLVAQGHADAALREYRASLAVREALATRDPTFANRKAIAVSHSKIGDVLLAQGNSDGALDEYRTFLTLAQELVAANPASDEGRMELARAHDLFGDVLTARGDTERALAEYRTLLAIATNLAGAAPTDEHRHLLCIGHEKLGEVLLARGESADALTEYRAMLELAETSAAKAPGDAVRQVDLAIAHEHVGQAQDARGNPAAALVEYRAMVTIAEALTAKDPSNGARQKELFVGQVHVGDVSTVLDKPADALVAYRAALAIAESLVARDPANVDYQGYLSVGHAEIGEVLLVQRDPAGALAQFHALLGTAKALAAKDPNNADRARDLAVAHAKVGVALQAQGHLAAALDEYRQYLATASTLAAKDPDNVDHQLVLEGAHGQVGGILLAQGNAAAAVDELRAYLMIAEALAAKDEHAIDRQQDLASAHEAVGDALSEMRDAAGARAEYEAALAVVRRLQASDPNNAVASKLATALAAKLRTHAP